ncbi:hypothetical protein SPHINGO391_400002 [Sphingomonas aurantiaca]|uniref:Uncharacterized protein n=1 Tax=Sphingomonas aurantiaca TaxID=185949 RepID=A0A5E7YV53_9SPHN|nr:hypothetical protein SPHINGO391_400002 [Sphingomonas aurantiaca]
MTRIFYIGSRPLHEALKAAHSKGF